MGILLLVGGLPDWGYGRQWGYRPTGVLSLVLVIVFILLVIGYVPRGFSAVPGPADPDPFANNPQ